MGALGLGLALLAGLAIPGASVLAFMVAGPVLGLVSSVGIGMVRSMRGQSEYNAQENAKNLFDGLLEDVNKPDFASRLNGAAEHFASNASPQARSAIADHLRAKAKALGEGAGQANVRAAIDAAAEKIAESGAGAKQSTRKVLTALEQDVGKREAVNHEHLTHRDDPGAAVTTSPPDHTHGMAPAGSRAQPQAQSNPDLIWTHVANANQAAGWQERVLYQQFLQPNRGQPSLNSGDATMELPGREL